MARAPEIDQRPDGQHGKPCGDVNEIGKCIRQDGRTRSTECVEEKSRRHAEQAELVP